MDNHSKETNKREGNSSADNNNSIIVQSELPLELLLEKDNDNEKIKKMSKIYWSLINMKIK